MPRVNWPAFGQRSAIESTCFGLAFGLTVKRPADAFRHRSPLENGMYFDQ
jgi:hypothetical protein